MNLILKNLTLNTPILVDGIPVDYSGLPESHRETARLYVEHGIQPGSGWTAILRDDLRAILIVDDETLPVLPAIYRWLVNHAPSNCWGSAEKMQRWIEARRGKGASHES